MDNDGDQSKGSAGNRRNQSPSVRFLNGYAEGFVFLVDECFRKALDITLTTLIDKTPTKELRLRKLQELGYSSWDNFKLGVINSDERRRIKKEINRYKLYCQVWTEGMPPEYSFDEGDILYSADGLHTVQVNSVTSDGLLSIRVFHGNAEGPSRYCKDLLCTQKEFVDILKDGIGSRL